MYKRKKANGDVSELVKNGKKKFVRYDEGAELYSVGIKTFMKIAKEARATYHIHRTVLVNTEKVDAYLELMSDYPDAY